MAMFEEAYISKLHVDQIIGGGVSPLIRKTRYLDAANGSNGNNGTTPDLAVKTLASALAKITTGKGDKIVLVGGASSLSLAANPAWSYNQTILAGNSTGMMNQRARIGQSVTFTPFFTVTGYGNTFAGLAFYHGAADTDLIGVQLSGNGNRNSFYNCHFHPQVGEIVNKTVYVNGVSETYFNNCAFGNNTVNYTSNGALLWLGQGNGITICDNCIFVIRSSNGASYFIYLDNTTDTGLLILRNCMFIGDMAGVAIVEGIKIASNGAGRVILDSQCQFVNVTDITNDSTDQYIYPAVPGYSASMNAEYKATVLVQS